MRRNEPMSNRPDPITLEHFPKSRGMRLGAEMYNAHGLARMIEQGGAWSRLVPHTRQPMTNAQIERIMRLAGMHQPPAPPAPTRQSHNSRLRSLLRGGTRFGPARQSPPRQASLDHPDMRLHLRQTIGATYPSRTLVPFVDGRSRPENRGSIPPPTVARELWRLMDREYENYKVAQMRRGGPLAQGVAAQAQARTSSQGPMGRGVAAVSRRLFN